MRKLPACPKCRYRLKESDAGSSNCPKCGNDISEQIAAVNATSRHTPRQPDQPSSPPNAEIPRPAGTGASYIDKLAAFLGLPAFLRRRRTLIFLGWGTLSLLVAASVFTSTSQVNVSAADDAARTSVDAFARSLPSSASPGVLNYKATEQTHTAPQAAYKVIYLTDHPSLKAPPLLSKDSPGSAESKRVALIWKMKFCSKNLISIMADNGIALVEGHVVDATTGEIHQIAMCTPGIYSSLPPPTSSKVPSVLQLEDRKP